MKIADRRTGVQVKSERSWLNSSLNRRSTDRRIRLGNEPATSGDAKRR